MKDPVTPGRVAGILDLIRDLGLAGDEELKVVAEIAGEERVGVEEVLLRKGMLSEETLASLVARQAGWEYRDVSGIEPGSKLLREIAPDGMKKWRFLPLREDGEKIVVASPEWRNPLHRDEVERYIGRPIRTVACSRSGFDGVIDRWVDSARAMRPSASALGPATEKKTAQEEVRARELMEDSSPYVRVLNSLLIDAIQKRASDIHLEAEEGVSIVRFRVDGVLIRAEATIDIAYHPRIVSRIKVLSDLDISETRRPQDGRFQFTAFGRTIDFRVSIIPSAHGEDVVIRILDKEHLRTEFSSLSLDRLGFSQNIVGEIRRLLRFPHGMFLVTGPTGSGKTTTLYAVLQEMDHGTRKFVTIEDPVEYNLPGVVQIPVNEAKGVTFASGLRSVLRHDPDVVMVGEIRDRETAEVAVQAALTGHLVFSTVHANNSTDVILRFLHMGIEPYNFVSAVNGVLSQRLLRVLCVRCRRKAPDDAPTIAAPAADRDRYYEAVGCSDCYGAGYRGRMSTGELVPFTEEIRDWMIQKRSFAEIRAGLRKSGIASLRENAMSLARLGKTSIQEVDRVTFTKEE